MSIQTRGARSRRADDTRETILSAAERLFAEHGIASVSHRQIIEAAGQGNNAAVAYHFGTKADVARAIEDKHRVRIESMRVRMLDEIGDTPELRDWVACLVRPLTDHLAEIGNPSWYARFAAQAVTDPAYRGVIIQQEFESPTLPHIVEQISRALPAKMHVERGIMMRTMLIYTCAEFERELAHGTPSPWSDWSAAAHGLIDAIVALMQGPVTRRVPAASRS